MTEFSWACPTVEAKSATDLPDVSGMLVAAEEDACALGTGVLRVFRLHRAMYERVLGRILSLQYKPTVLDLGIGIGWVSRILSSYGYVSPIKTSKKIEVP